MKKYLLLALWFSLVVHAPAQMADAQAGPKKVVFENQEWIDYRVYDADKTDRPRVLLIGDSISGHYFDGLAKALKGKAYVARMGSSICCCDPNYLDTVKLALAQHHYAVIYFNNGLHGGGYTEEDYDRGLARLVDLLKANAAPGAKLIWASSTQLRFPKAPFDKFLEMNDRIIARNKFAAELMAKENIPVDDLYTLMLPHHDLMTDGVHYNPDGQAILTQHVTETVTAALKGEKWETSNTER